MTDVPVYTHPAMLQHRPPEGHAERPERLTAVLAALGNLAKDRRQATSVSDADLLLVHPQGYLDALKTASPAQGIQALDPDTFMSPRTLEAARLAAGAVTEAVRAVVKGEANRAFCAIRPPGHHAEPTQPMGFCFYSNVAIGALVARAEGLAKVAVVDFDVHHGNGTQAVFEKDASLMFASVHQSPAYPGTGDPSETGVGNIANATVPPHAARSLWRQKFEGLIEKVDAFAPDLILISAGFDAHAMDPLANQELEAEDYAWATRAILTVARKTARGRVVSSLEGGYDLNALGASAAAHVRALGES